MQEIFKFLSIYWKDILAGVLFVVALIVALIRKRSITDIYSRLYNWCISAINVAEKSDYKGQDKLNFAFGLVCKFFELDYPDLKVSNYEVVIKGIIERILTTPQKKGE